MGVLKYFLGIKVVRSENGFFISQQNYTLDIIDDSGAQGCRPCNFPMEQNLRSHGDENGKMLMHQYTTNWWGICFISLLFDQT